MRPVALVVFAAMSIGLLDAGSARAAVLVGAQANGTSSGPVAATAASTAASLGATVFRVNVRWDLVQRQNTQSYDFSGFDPVIQALQGRGIRPLLLVNYAPTWAQDPLELCTQSPRCPPGASFVDEFGKFADAVVRHYSGLPVAGAQQPSFNANPVGVQIWNEQNTTVDWKTLLKPPDATRYTAMLEAAAVQIRASAPNLLIVLGGLATNPTNRSNITPATFLDRVYAAGGGPHFDRIAMHEYPYPGPSTTIQQIKDAVYNDIRPVRQVRDAHGDSATPFTITESGIKDPEQVFPPATTQGGDLSAIYDELGASREPTIDAWYVFQLYEPPGQAEHFGLLDGNWQPHGTKGFCELKARFNPGPFAGC